MHFVPQVGALDPGRREVFVYSTKTTYPGKGQPSGIKRFTGAHYRHLAGFQRTVAKAQSWQRQDNVYQSIIQGLYLRSIKSINPDNIRVSIHFICKCPWACKYLAALDNAGMHMQSNYRAG